MIFRSLVLYCFTALISISSTSLIYANDYIPGDSQVVPGWWSCTDDLGTIEYENCVGTTFTKNLEILQFYLVDSYPGSSLITPSELFVEEDQNSSLVFSASNNGDGCCPKKGENPQLPATQTPKMTYSETTQFEGSVTIGGSYTVSAKVQCGLSAVAEVGGEASAQIQASGTGTYSKTETKTIEVPLTINACTSLQAILTETKYKSKVYIDDFFWMTYVIGYQKVDCDPNADPQVYNIPTDYCSEFRTGGQVGDATHFFNANNIAYYTTNQTCN